MIKKISKMLSNNISIFIFLLLVIILLVLGLLYMHWLVPLQKDVDDIIKKFQTDNYILPYFVAERYLTWYNMRTYFFALYYLLTLTGIYASFITVFYASKGKGKNKSKKKTITHKKILVFLSLFSTCFTIAAIFIKPDSMAYMSQHAWRQLDNCIMETIVDDSLTNKEKDNKIILKIIEIEQYIETFEH